MIENIPTGERHYFHRIDDIPRLILPYLEETDLKLGQVESISRGRITEAPGRSRRYIKWIRNVLTATGSYVKRASTSLTWLAHLRDWCQRRRW